MVACRREYYIVCHLAYDISGSYIFLTATSWGIRHMLSPSCLMISIQICNSKQHHLMIFIYLFIIIHPYCYICNTGLVQLYITKNYNTYTTSQTVTVISYPYRVIKQQFPCAVQSNAHSKIH